MIEEYKTPLNLAPQKSLLPLETMPQFPETVIPGEFAYLAWIFHE
jgi:hypothetical protein